MLLFTATESVTRTAEKKSSQALEKLLVLVHLEGWTTAKMVLLQCWELLTGVDLETLWVDSSLAHSLWLAHWTHTWGGMCSCRFVLWCMVLLSVAEQRIPHRWHLAQTSKCKIPKGGLVSHNPLLLLGSKTSVVIWEAGVLGAGLKHFVLYRS